MICKGYSGGPFGQVHWRLLEPEEPSTQPDLYCLHPAPFSGLAFTGIMPHLAQGRRVIAPDFPGHGGSDAFKQEPSIEEYVEAMLAVIANLSGDTPVDLMGFHTGNLVAVEIAISQPDHVRRLALVDVPAFDADTRDKYRATAARPLEITPQLSCLDAAWERGMSKRLQSQGPDRSFEMFVEQLRHGKKMNAAFHAGFSYDVDARLPQVTHPAMVLASQSVLLAATYRASKLISTAKLVERTDVTRAVLDEAATRIASEILLFLNGDNP